MAENGKASESKTTRVKATKSEALTCVGNICFNTKTGKLEVELNRDSCPTSVIKDIVENIVKGVEVEFVLPREAQKEQEKAK